MALSTTYAFWPKSWMPAPQEDSFSFQPENLREVTETEVGAVIRPQFDSDVLNADCALVLNRMQSAWFEAFEKAMNQESLWFLFPVWYGGKLHDALCMFKDRPKWTVEAYTTTYKFSLLVQKRSLEYGPCVVEMLACWDCDEVFAICEGIADAVVYLDKSTLVGGWYYPPCVVEMLACWDCDEVNAVSWGVAGNIGFLNGVTIIGDI